MLFLDKVAISSPKLSHTAILIKRHKVLNNAIFRFIYCSLPKNHPVQEKKNNLFGFFKKSSWSNLFVKKEWKLLNLTQDLGKLHEFFEVSNFLKNLMRKKSWNCSGIFIIITSSNPVYQGFKYLLKNTFSEISSIQITYEKSLLT